MNYVAKSLLILLSSGALVGCQHSPKPTEDSRPLAKMRLVIDGPSSPPDREEADFLSNELRDLKPDLVRLTVRPSDLSCDSFCFDDFASALTSNRTQAIITLAVNDGTINGGLSPNSAEDRAQYLEFVREVVDRLSNVSVAYYQLGERVNSEGRWRPKVDVAAYSNLYKETTTLLQTIDPDSPLIPSTITDGDTAFLNGFLDAVGSTSILVLQMSPQHWGQSPASYQLNQKAVAFQEAVAARLPQAEVWITGIDYGTHVGGSSVQQQADWYTDAMMLGLDGDRIDAIGFRGLEKDRSAVAPYDGAASGLFTVDGERKPAYDRFSFLQQHTSGRFYRETITAPEGLQAISYRSAERGDYMTILRSQSDAPRIVEANVSANSAVLHRPTGRTVLQPAFEYVTFTVGRDPVVLHSHTLPQFSEDPSISLGFDEELQYNTPFEIIYTEKPYRSEPEYLIFRKTATKWEPMKGFNLLSTRSDSSLAAHQIVYTMTASEEVPENGSLNLNLHVGNRTNPYGVLDVPFKMSAPLDLQVKQDAEKPALKWEFKANADAGLEQITVQSTVDQGTLHVPDRFVYTDEAATQNQAGAVTLSTDNSLRYSTVITTEAQVPGYPAVTRTLELAPQIILPIGDSLSIEGDLTEWDGTTSFALDRIEQVVADWNPFGEAVFLDDASALVSLAFDDGHLYIAGTVRDDVLSSPGKAGDLYLNDGIEVYLNLDLAGDFGTTRYSSDDFQLGLYWEHGKPVVYTWPSRRYLTSATIAMVTTDSGYTVEASIPWSELGGKPAEGSMIGFNVALSDDDSPAYNLPEGQEKMLTWNGKGSLFRNPSNFVSIQFGEVSDE